MLFDTFTPEEIVDSEAALEFMKEATKLASAEELEDIGQRLEEKSTLFREILAHQALDDLDEVAFARLTRQIFSVRRKAGRLLRHNGIATLRGELAHLLHGPGSPADRLDRFVARIGGLEPAKILSLATESLHFSQPNSYWLWTHWVWHPEAKTGALALVTQDAVELGGDSPGQVYLEVGRATALVNARGHSEGFADVGRGLFGTDIFLACVYSVYMYTVFRIKLSQEFNRILPELPELVRRVLGVHRLETSP